MEESNNIPFIQVHFENLVTNHMFRKNIHSIKIGSKFNKEIVPSKSLESIDQEYGCLLRFRIYYVVSNFNGNLKQKQKLNYT